MGDRTEIGGQMWTFDYRLTNAADSVVNFAGELTVTVRTSTILFYGPFSPCSGLVLAEDIHIIAH